MKKIIISLMIVAIICFSFVTIAAAEDTELTETEVIEPEDTTVIEKTDDLESTLEDSFLSNEAIDKIIALGQELRELKESDYTFEERILQLVNSENLSSTIGTLMTVIASIAIFVFRSIQKKDYTLNSTKITEMEKQILDLADAVDAEKTENIALRETVITLVDVITNNTTVLEKINIDTEENRHIADVAKTATIATAKMVSDAFGHSRTIDAATKELITRDYLEVLKADEPTEV